MARDADLYGRRRGRPSKTFALTVQNLVTPWGYMSAKKGKSMVLDTAPLTGAQ